MKCKIICSAFCVIFLHILVYEGIPPRHWRYLLQYIVGPQYRRFVLCCCCVLLKNVNNILLLLCWCKYKRAILCWCWFVHIDPYILKQIGDNLSRIWTSLNAQFGKNKSHCPEGLIYSAIFNVNQAKIFRPSLLIVFCWIWNKIVGWILPKNIDVVTLLGAFG